MDYNRQLDIFNPEKFNKPVHIIGCGATGSWVAMTLAKMGVKHIELWDFDELEAHNIPNQLFPMSSIGVNKASALADTISDFAPDTKFTVHEERATRDSGYSGIVFMLTDTMTSRSEIFRGGIKNNVGVDLYIETRMGSDNCRVYAINPCKAIHIKKYQKTLYDDDTAEVSVCGTAKSIAPTASLTASYAVWQMIKYLDGTELDNELIIDFRYNQGLYQKF